MASQPTARVLIPESHSAKTLACVRSLGTRGVGTLVVKEEGQPSPGAASRYCDEVVTAPSPHENLVAYRNALLAFAARADVRTIIPTREEDAFVLSQSRSQFGSHVETVWPDFERLRIVHDALELATVAADAGLQVPETRRFDDVTDWNRPLVLKARYSILTPAYVDFLGPTECEGQIDPRHHGPGPPPDRTEIREYMLGHLPVVQEYVPIRHEYSVRALYDQGECVASSVRRQYRGKSYAGGASVYRELVENSTVERLGRQLLDELEWHGLAVVQFIEAADDSGYWLLEVNPRTWTSLPCDIRAGADYPYFVWQLMTGDRGRIDSTHETGVGTHLLHGELRHLWSILAESHENVDRPSITRRTLEILRSVYHCPNFDYLRLDDPRPFLRGLRTAL